MGSPATIRIVLFNVVYGLLLTLSFPWLIWRYFAQQKNRRGWKTKLFGSVPIASRPTTINDSNSSQLNSPRCIWLHAVSVGEVNLLEPLVKRLVRRFPQATLAISTTTETGFDLANNKFADQTVFFFPSDFSWALNRAFNRIRPDLIVLAELEVWPNFLQIANQRKIPIAIFNGRLSESSARGYGRLKWLLRPTFEGLDLVAAQDQIYADRFIKLGCATEKVQVAGNVKFDGARLDKNDPAFQPVRALARQIGLSEQHQVFVAGSTQIEDELAAAKAFLSLQETWSDLRLVIVPRHPARVAEIVSLLDSLGLTSILRSSFSSEASARQMTLPSSSVLIVDVIGELNAWWSLADVAFVGGSMGSRGGQNMIEPAALGVPVCFGPNTKNFRAVVEQLLTGGGACVVENEIDLAAFVGQLLSDPKMSQKLRLGAQKVITQNAGAADRTVDLLANLLKTTCRPVVLSPLRGRKKPAA